MTVSESEVAPPKSPFPAAERVHYKRNTLREVVCQLTFPQILQIMAPPISFQERIRAEYPVYKAPGQDGPGGLPPGLPPELAKLLSGPLKVQNQQHHFISGDERWRVSLDPSFVALTTSAYPGWDEFEDRLRALQEALIEIYSPAFFERVGLRYVNVIDRVRLGLENRPWSQLLGPAAAFPAIGDERLLREAQHALVFDIGQSQVARLTHGLVVIRSKRTGERSGYKFDSDFFTLSRTEVSAAHATLKSFNVQARQLFRWCISPELHEAMEPERI